MTSEMAHKVVESSKGTAEQMVTIYNPMSMSGAGGASRRASRDLGMLHPDLPQSVASASRAEIFLSQEMKLAVKYVETLLGQSSAGFSERELDYFIRNKLYDHLEMAARTGSVLHR